VVRQVLQDTATFSSRQIARYSSLMGETWDLIPAEKDPPEHGRFRRFLNPLFSPTAMRRLEGRIRANAAELVEAVRQSGGCEFITDFAQPFPILIFMAMMGFPAERFADFVRWGHDLHDGITLEDRMRGARASGAYLEAEIERVRAEPDDTVLSVIVHGEAEGAPFTPDEVKGMVYLLFGGAIHTVTATLGYSALHLARHRELQDELRASPVLIPQAIDELMRAYSVVHSFRRVTRDVEIGGVTMKAGDWVRNTLPIANRDPAAFDRPEVIDIHREQNRHVGFSFGNHFCLGSHLARLEMTVAWEELLARLPAFKVADDAAPELTTGLLLGVHRLELAWD
jgi:cytochrome P450